MESMGLVGCWVLRRTVSRPTAGGSQRERLGASPQFEVQNPKSRMRKPERGRCGRAGSTRRGVLRAPIPFRFAFFVVGIVGSEGTGRRDAPEGYS